MTCDLTVLSFDHRDLGTPEQAWQPLVDALVNDADPLLSPTADDHLVVVAAHPDDETLGAGGLIAAAAAAGARVSVIVASAGEASHPDSPTHLPERLARLRRAEVRAALHTLAPDARLIMLDLPDGQLEAYRNEISDAIDHLTDQPQPGNVYLVAPWEGDQHPDHGACASAAAASRVAQHAVRWEYPVWAWHWADPNGGQLPGSRLRALRLSDAARAAKRRALDCHVSQHRPLSAQTGDEAILQPAMLAHFDRSAEIFVEKSIGAPDFDRLYAEAPDPWGLADRFYEQRKRAVLMASLTRRRFARAFEPGCATGLITAELATRCDEVVAWDVAGAALAQANARLMGSSNVYFQRRAVPEQWPEGSFDLIVLSEVGYYCADPSVLAERVTASLRPDGVVIACHWRHPAPHPQTAEAVHEALGFGRREVVRHVEQDFLLQVWTQNGLSVAATEGIV